MRMQAVSDKGFKRSNNFPESSYWTGFTAAEKKVVGVTAKSGDR